MKKTQNSWNFNLLGQLNPNKECLLGVSRAKS